LPRENITTLPLRNSLDAQSARRLSQLVKKHEIEIVHAHMARDYPLAAFAVRKNSAKLIVTRHVLFPLNRLNRITLSKAARIIAVSEAVATQLRASAIAPAEKITVILNGIDADRFVNARVSFDRSQFLSDWKLPAESLLIGTVGELNPLKGQEDFLLAARQILKHFPAAQFIIAGIDHSPDGKNRKHLEQLIDQLELKEHVRLVGWLEDLAQLYCALDVFVSASHTESFGLVLAEAMASETAVVATQTDGAVEIIQHGETGVLVPIGDVGELGEAVRGLLADKDLRVRLGTAAQQSAVTRFSVKRMVEETEAIYRKAMQEC
jgi:L-malate glycosyltransferase